MTPIILDVNVLVRLADLSAPLHPIAKAAVSRLHTAGETLRTVPQSVYEFWVVATRPRDKNGLSLSIADCEHELTRLQAAFPLLDDQPGLFAEWRTLVADYQCHGKVAHDARYVAAMRTHGITRILTFNVDDFARYPHITVLDPKTIAASATPPSTTP